MAAPWDQGPSQSSEWRPSDILLAIDGKLRRLCGA